MKAERDFTQWRIRAAKRNYDVVAANLNEAIRAAFGEHPPDDLGKVMAYNRPFSKARFWVATGSAMECAGYRPAPPAKGEK